MRAELRAGLLAAVVVASACFYAPVGSSPAADESTGSSDPGATTMPDPDSTTTAEPTSETSEPETTGSTTESSTATASTSLVPTCGNGILEADEDCDDGDQDDGDACTNKCTLAVCGDGIVGPGELCDDANDDDDDACDNTCLFSICGDGVVQPGEDCDTRGESQACNADCTSAACGDGTLNLSAGETCDDGGETPACDADCSQASCGDGNHNASAGEACDDGNSDPGDTCSQSCASTRIVDMALSAAHACVVFDGGAVRCWGSGADGALGTGNTDNLGDQPGELPVADIDAGGKVVGVSCGEQFTCIVLDTGAVRCWGRNTSGQLGNGAFDPLGDQPGELPTSDIDIGAGADVVTSGVSRTCVITTDGHIRCWGPNPFLLGYWMEDGPVLSPPNKLDVPSIADVAQLAHGYISSCARQLNGDVRCFGNVGLVEFGVVGDDVLDVPYPKVELGVPAIHVDVSYSHTCVVLQGGAVRCWGSGEHGILGTGDTNDVGDEPDEPLKDVVLGGPAKQVATGKEHTCALLTTGKVKCWGYGTLGRLGTSSNVTIQNASQFPPIDLELGDDAVRLFSGDGAVTCALLADDTLRCWGANGTGVLGYGHKNPVGDDEHPATAGAVPF